MDYMKDRIRIESPDVQTRNFKCQNEKCGFGFYVYGRPESANCPSCGTRTDVPLQMPKGFYNTMNEESQKGKETT